VLDALTVDTFAPAVGDVFLVEFSSI